MYLHASGGLTLPRLKQVCAATGILSPGRARAVLLYLRFLRYVEPAEPEGRVARYAPTAALWDSWRQMMIMTIEAAQLLEPGVMLMANRAGDPATLLALSRVIGQTAMGLARLGEKENPFWRVFLNRYAGMQILHRLMLAARQGELYPPDGALPFSVTDLAQEFRVSRPHVTRMFQAAEREGLVIFEGKNSVRLQAYLRESIRYSLGLRLATTIFAVATVRAELPEAEPHFVAELA
jgi:AraC-like DNA-binding protein